MSQVVPRACLGCQVIDIKACAVAELAAELSKPGAIP